MALVRFEPSYPRWFPDSQPDHIGFDPKGPWQMVPHKGYRHLHLSAAGVKGWSVEPVTPDIVSLERVDPQDDDKNVFKVEGLNQGSTFLIAKGAKGEQLAKIEIEVKPLRKRSIRFFLVSDKAGHKTTFTEKDTKAWTDFINDSVFEPQINVRFEYLDTGPIKVDQDLGKRIDFASIGDMPYVKREGKAGENWHQIVDAGKPKSDVFNVFCVWDFVNHSNEGEENVAFVASKERITADQMEKPGQNYNICMFRQKDSPDFYYKHVLAHEVGHYLNRMPSHTSGKDQLMTPGEIGTFLGKADAKRMNP